MRSRVHIVLALVLQHDEAAVLCAVELALEQHMVDHAAAETDITAIYHTSKIPQQQGSIVDIELSAEIMECMRILLKAGI